MNKNLRTKVKSRYTVVVVDTNHSTDEINQAALRYFDEYCDAELWVKTHGSLYGGRELDDEISRFFRIEKRYYLV